MAFLIDPRSFGKISSNSPLAKAGVPAFASIVVSNDVQESHRLRKEVIDVDVRDALCAGLSFSAINDGFAIDCGMKILFHRYISS